MSFRIHPAYRYLLTFDLQIHKAKAEKARARVIQEEMDAKRAKNKAARERRNERVQTKRNALTAEDEAEDKKTEQ
jgi:hypothetical protein